MKNTPHNQYKVSAIISLYNSEVYIEGCLRDLLAQTIYTKGELEIIVIDSASPQNEGDIVKQYAKKHRHIVYLRTHERETLYAAWNRGIRMARGIYVTNANTDDRHHPEALEKLAATLDANPDFMLAYAHCKVSLTPNATWSECSGDEVYRYPFFFPPLCLLHYMFGPQPLWRKEIHECIGEFDATLFAVGDLDFNIRFCLAGLKAVLVPEVLGLFLKSATSITSSFPRQAQEKAMIMRKWRHPENVLKLFEATGQHATSPMDQASLLNDFAIDAMSFTTPWNTHDSAPALALDCIASALTLTPGHTGIQKNLKIMKSTMTESALTKHALQRLRPQIGTPCGHAYSVRRETRQQERNTQSQKKHIISFFAGVTDHFHFIKPLLNHFTDHGHTVQIINSKEIKQKGLYYFLTRCDIAWFEWGNGHIVEASQLPKTCKIVCRVHRYEVYQPRMAQVNWNNVDYAIFVNARFIDEYKLVSGIDLQKTTKVIEIPNPLLSSAIFHDRVPGFNIAHISRFHADKNPLFALQILASLVLHDNRYKLYMIGGIQDIQLYHSCLDFVAKQKIQKNFIYEGIRDDVDNWLLDKSFILSTSLVESQGMAVLEAMRQGIKPIIYSGFGMERTFAQEHMFMLPEEATNMIFSKKYDSWSYRKEALARFGAQGILRGIDQITRGLFGDTSPTTPGIEMDACHAARHMSSPSKQSLHNAQTNLRSRLDQKGWGRRFELYSQVLEDFEQESELNSPAISIVVISWRLHSDTIKSFKILEKQKDLNFELIFVDNGGTPGEFDCLIPYINTYIRLNNNSGAYLARNIGSIFSKAPILFFLDDDAIPTENIIQSHLDCFNNYDVIAVRGVCKPKTENPLNQLAKHYYLGSNPYPIYADLEGNTSYLASSFFKAGGWDDEIRFGGGGVDLSRRLLEIEPDMRKQIYSPDSIIFHDYALNNEQLDIKNKKQQESRNRLKIKHSDYDRFLTAWVKFTGREDLLIKKNKHLCKIHDRALNTSPNKINDYQPNMITNNTFISICIPTYNREQYISETILSALEQNHDNSEIIIIDDGSTDNTEIIVKSFASEKIKYFKKHHTNSPDTRNRCISEAKGEFILWLDSDDILAPNLILRFLDILNEYPGIDVCYGDIQPFGDLGSFSRKIIVYEDYYKKNAHLLSGLVLGNKIPNAGTFIRKDLFSKVGMYNTDFRRAHDYEFWIRSAPVATFKHIGMTSLFWRWHETNMSAENKAYDTSFESLLLAKMIQEHTLQTLFPALNWTTPESATLVARSDLARMFVRWKDLNAAMSQMEQGLLSLFPNLTVPKSEHRKLNAFKLAYQTLFESTGQVYFQKMVQLIFRMEKLLCTPSNQNLSESTPIEAAIKSDSNHHEQTVTTLEEMSSEKQHTNPDQITDKNTTIEPTTAEKETRGPLVSVIIPTVNRPDQILEAILSVENQTYEHIEIILVNDGGTELSRLNDKLPNTLRKTIIYINLPHNRGRSFARNKGIEAASGEFFIYLDDDDIFYPHHVETLVNYLESTGMAVAYTDANRAFKVIKDGIIVTDKVDRPFSENFSQERFLKENYIPIHCVMHRRICLETVGYFDTNLMRTEDWDLWIRISREYTFFHIEDVTCEYAWEEERQPLKGGGGWEPYNFAALHMFYKYRNYVINDPKNRAWHKKIIDKAITNLTKALRTAITKKDYNPPALFGTNDMDWVVESCATLPRFYLEEQLRLETLAELVNEFSELKSIKNTKVIAFHLPQYHPIPENDLWWGKGFTEWTNVAKARPLFPDHYQPHIPADLGFYDLRLPATRTAQADLAREYGIHGFCYYHYWFNGKLLLEQPVHDMLQSGEPNFPFCLCWANENWTRVWDGESDNILMEQIYSLQDDMEHIHYMFQFFRDHRYIRVNDRPLFLIYRASRLPNPQETCRIWREEARKAGIGELYLCRVESFRSEHSDPVALGFDAAIEFQPDWSRLGHKLSSSEFGNHSVYKYESVIQNMLDKPTVPYTRFPCVTPSWDNSPRKPHEATVLQDATPELYGKWLHSALLQTQARHPKNPIVFINAWNEWGEGNHLEPDLKFGKAFLEETKNAINAVHQIETDKVHAKPCVSIIIPVFNNLKFTKQCLKALIEATPENFYEVVIIDNGSTDGTHEFLSCIGGDIRIISNKNNVGFARACNQGATIAQGHYLVFLNNDTIPQGGWLTELVNCMDSHPEAGIAGSKLLYPDDTIQHCGAAMRFDGKFFRHPYKYLHRNHPLVNRTRELDAVTAACFITSRELFFKLGKFDEHYLNGCEDMDYCTAVRRSGATIHYVPTSELYHLESQTPRPEDKDRDNFQRYLKKWGKGAMQNEVEIYAKDGFWLQNGEDYSPSPDAVTMLKDLGLSFNPSCPTPAETFQKIVKRIFPSEHWSKAD